MSSKEKIALVVGALMLFGFITQPVHGVHPSWVAVLALGALASSGVVSANTLQRANWSFALLFGILASISIVFAETQLDKWFAVGVVSVIGDLGASPFWFVLALTVLCFAISVVIRWQASAPLITIALVPVAASVGIDPFVVGFVAVVACNTFFFSYQSTTYLVLYHGTDGQLFTHFQAVPMAIAYALVTLIAIATSVPIWGAMGLL
jgi:divalent anion:Na+ symporter, DASS family